MDIFQKVGYEHELKRPTVIRTKRSSNSDFSCPPWPVGRSWLRLGNSKTHHRLWSKCQNNHSHCNGWRIVYTLAGEAGSTNNPEPPADYELPSCFFRYQSGMDMYHMDQNVVEKLGGRPTTARMAEKLFISTDTIFSTHFFKPHSIIFLP